MGPTAVTKKAPKRKAAPLEEGSHKKPIPEPEQPAGSSADHGGQQPLVNPKRLQFLKAGTYASGPVVYWMSRDQRVDDNWALLYALEQAAKSRAPVAVAFNLVPAFLGAGARHWGFMLRGLRELAAKLGDKDIAFFMLKGDPTDTLPQLVEQTGAGLLVTDFSPLRVGRQWRTQVAERLPGSTVMVEVDAHNVVPCWVVSNKRETAARTIRPKVHKALPEFLVPFPATPTAPAAWARTPGLLQPELVDWEGLLREVLARGADVPEVVWCVPGEAAARAALDGPTGFLSPARLALYAAKRNDPNAQALSNMSPYLHYGQIAPARAALEAAKHRARYKEAVEGFLEELVVRRELADNFCQFTPDYDNISCAAAWARESLDLHRSDPRPYSYTRAQWEEGRTHDELWNACQLEMVHLGKMHGFMRMYWAKKILEWTASPEDAIELAIYLNDKYELDGRDPNGYVGVMWSMVGIHDQGWGERAIFGKIRYMNYAGCKRKFDIPGYVSYVNRAVKAELNARQKKATAVAVRNEAANGSGASGSNAPAKAVGVGGAKVATAGDRRLARVKAEAKEAAEEAEAVVMAPLATGASAAEAKVNVKKEIVPA